VIVVSITVSITVSNAVSITVLNAVSKTMSCRVYVAYCNGFDFTLPNFREMKLDDIETRFKIAFSLHVVNVEYCASRIVNVAYFA